MDDGNRDRGRENGHCSLAVFITKNHVKMAALYFPLGGWCEIPWLA